ncbi:homoserine dehydrogenase [Litorivicinus lipolyticus]|uniref:Homoserine dehydrogenase n=1 Tax=Litorivicinus lipolyticus TaxID=418701 RepID=A0A5Q2QEJ8_9GAMM|nr:homoserine dehydrogenase [Litorivicinus lipolyticus]QGG80781.1 homoserine dehydrogenase [Litorivicinus lipolyticus]
MEPIKIGLCGLGTVAQGTLEVLRRNQSEIERRVGSPVKVTCAGVRTDKPDVDLSGIRVERDMLAVATAADVDIVVELIGGTDLALKLVMAAIEAGKGVVTANKALIAIHGNEIFAAAQARGVMVAFEAAVAGGIPIIKAIREGLSANRIQWLAGIINGTGNFILTEMSEKGRAFDEVLAEAQALGYAEADPTFDVEGIDAAHKLTILASIAFGVPLQFDACYTEGIGALTPADVANADQLGYKIKHLGVAKRTGGGIELRVHPTLMPKNRLLSNVNGVLNALQVQGDAVGPTTYTGPGAGGEPTASAVVADIVDVARTLTADPLNRVPHLAFHADALGGEPILSIDQIHSAYYLRLQVADTPGVLSQITKRLGDHAISIESIVQKQVQDPHDSVPVVLLTGVVKEADMNAALAEIEALESVLEPAVKIRVESLV